MQRALCTPTLLTGAPTDTLEENTSASACWFRDGVAFWDMNVPQCSGRRRSRLVKTGANPPPGVRKLVVCPRYMRAAYRSASPP